MVCNQQVMNAHFIIRRIGPVWKFRRSLKSSECFELNKKEVFHIKILSAVSKIAGYQQLLQISTGLNGEFSIELWRLEIFEKETCL